VLLTRYRTFLIPVSAKQFIGFSKFNIDTMLMPGT